MSRREICSWLMDMDGVLVREQQPVPGAQEFLAQLRELGLPFLVLTGVTGEGEAERQSYRPSRIIGSVAELIDEVGGASDAA